ncbi:MAG: (2Fe-2S)-binding protein [Rhodospirillaceae bacterium]|nr:(2Fe-2S)-binding protein [Rhodospirillaceae bacterium]MYF86098.1 (2Fe-2S)-binding protein [Rhodospirillaceae bacterium]MYH37116.1 (2Fe-2S)-binding protein [Rhodospirillaceae bacterium]MYK13077.1 (2Fe-2S)-binding protein [Rhodospirillaceae bacterium]MYK60051.1 (2Fe-2S)-binding protein [Rhodospirillaceae bacterium]
MPDRLEPRFDLAFTLNGAPVETATTTSTTLADLLRERRDGRGTKLACERAVCGACTVLVDDVPRASCSVFAFEVAGSAVNTIEGLADDGELSPVQAAFADNSAFQCGFCTAGMILLTEALLARDPDPDNATVRDWISSNICRCTGYSLILKAVRDAAWRKREAAE